jgi:integrase
LAALTVADFDKRTSELTIRKDKTGKTRRVTISSAAATLFTAQSKSKLPGALLFTRSDGKAWDKETWNGPIQQGTAAAGLAEGITAYTLRHSVITDLVNANVPLLTISQIAGTSVEMIERHYGHLVKDAAVEGLNALAL